MEKLTDLESLCRGLESIIGDAGGEVVGRTRLQKMACLLDIAGYRHGFDFEYKHYGPYSEMLYSISKYACSKGLIREKESPTAWGGWFSTYNADAPCTADQSRKSLSAKMASANLIELELAVTAAFLASRGVADPWGETAPRKPTKATVERLAAAKALYADLREIQSPTPLPAIL